ncbi:MAG: aminotransferase class IV [Sulfurovum sp.]|nr:aminotransferase class IV [Sulfurovum sp.]
MSLFCVTQQSVIFLRNFLPKRPALLLETIRCENGKAFHLSYHQDRVDKSRKVLLSLHDTLRLSDIITPPPQGLYRCRILYDEHIHSIEYIPYQAKEISTLKIVSSAIDYDFKYANRDALNALSTLHHEVDDILITQEGYIRDTSIANIAFYTGKVWHTPKIPLLYGTMRQYYIDQGLLEEKAIHITDLASYTQVALMNAMIGFRTINPMIIYHSKDKYESYHFPNP